MILCYIATFSLIQIGTPITEVDVKVEKGESLGQVASKLYREGVVEHPFWFKVWAKITGNDRKIKAGYYKFKKPSSVRDALRILVLGKSINIKVTIVEGSTLKEIANLLRVECGVDEEEFLRLTHDTAYVKSFGIDASSLEGYLFPDSYLIPYGAKPDEIISRMVEQFFKVFTPEFMERAKELGLSVEEVVILASLIEKEAVLDEEKPIISGVYHKRLRRSQLLQCDATIQYILPNRKSRLAYSDLRIPSSYNTYIHKGLPPGAIASPGKSSIIAALWPKSTEYMYFVARGDGGHIFSKTLKEHNRAKLEVRSKRLEIGD